MELKKIRVQNFKCIDDSGEFAVSDATCLVGKNESGKTALLEALYKLNSTVAGDGDFAKLEFPRARWADFGGNEPVLTTTWELSQDDVAALEGVLGAGCLGSNEVIVTKGYDNTSRWSISLNETAIVQHLVGRGDLTDKAIERTSAATSVSDLIGILEKGETQGESALLDIVNEQVPETSPSRVARLALSERLPHFLHFPEYAVMPGRIAVDQLVVRKAADDLSTEERIFVALLELVGTTPEELSSITSTEELIAEIEGVSNSISTEIFKYWTQNRHLRVDFKLLMGRTDDPAPFNQGWVFETRIWNNRHQVSVNFDERSSGFTWFFSFLVWFSMLKSAYGEKLFVLLDEPGLSLHARAQGDLLRFFRERLQPEHQVIYTTHSPFMIDPDNLTKARTVEDVVEKDGEGEILKGTKVGDQILSNERDTIFPLYAALGYDITQTLFVGKNTILVEGPSDLLYMKWASHKLQSEDRTHLDPRWVISPTGGVDKVTSFVTLFGGIDLNVVVVTDYATGVKSSVEKLRESELLKAGHVLSVEAYTDQDQADIEDLLGRDNYIVLVNAALGWEGAHAIPTEQPEGVDVRVIAEVEAHHRTLPAETAEFDSHYLPALYLTEHQGELNLPAESDALDRFEKLFADLNELLVDE